MSAARESVDAYVRKRHGLDREAFWAWLVGRMAKSRAAGGVAGISAHSALNCPGWAEHEAQAELKRLRDAGKIACTNGIWWVR